MRQLTTTCPFCRSVDDKHWNFCKYMQQHNDWFLIYDRDNYNIWIIFPSYFTNSTKKNMLVDFNGEYVYTDTFYQTTVPLVVWDYYNLHRARVINKDSQEWEDAMRWLTAGI